MTDALLVVLAVVQLVGYLGIVAGLLLLVAAVGGDRR